MSSTDTGGMDFISEEEATLRSGLTDPIVFLTLNALRDGEPHSRKLLAEDVGCTERIARRSIDNMKDMGFLEVGASGVRITGYGMDLLESLGIELVDFDWSQYDLGRATQSVVLRRAAHLIGDGGEQRSVASEHGCGTCSIWTMNRNRLVMLPCWNTDANDPVLAGRIRVRIGLSNDDVLIVTGGDDGYSVREGAIATALSAL